MYTSFNQRKCNIDANLNTSDNVLSGNGPSSVMPTSQNRKTE